MRDIEKHHARSDELALGTEVFLMYHFEVL